MSNRKAQKSKVQRDNEKLLKTLEKLRDLGNTVIVVEHLLIILVPG